MAKKKAKGTRFFSWGFLSIVVVLYVVIFIITPQKSSLAVKSSVHIMLQITIPLSVAFAMMVLLNLFVDPVHLAKILGEDSGIKGVSVSTLAGLLSMGPIYAWYPFLSSLKAKGVSNFHIANFLCCRAVKPFLLPVMIFYFGWLYTITLNVLVLFGALFVGSLVNLLI